MSFSYTRALEEWSFVTADWNGLRFSHLGETGLAQSTVIGRGTSGCAYQLFILALFSAARLRMEMRLEKPLPCLAREGGSAE